MTFDSVSVPAERVSKEIASRVVHLGVPRDSRMKVLGELGGRYRNYTKAIRRGGDKGFDLAVCRGATASPFGLVARKFYRAPLIVESFEPHSEYMLASGEWSPRSPKYFIQKHFEGQVVRHADRVVTVSKLYANALISQNSNLRRRVATLPCRIDERHFRFDERTRSSVRTDLGVKGTVCVYAGKFGGLYYQVTEAAEALGHISRCFGDSEFSLLVVTTDCHEPIRSALRSKGLEEQTSIVTADPNEVPGYLSASDFAISLHRTSAWSFAFSPIKHAEYWASGLPVICPKSVGDDAERIPGSALGSVADFTDPNSLAQATKEIQALLRDGDYRASTRLAWLRSFDANELIEYYRSTIDELFPETIHPSASAQRKRGARD